MEEIHLLIKSLKLGQEFNFGSNQLFSEKRLNVELIKLYHKASPVTKIEMLIDFIFKFEKEVGKSSILTFDYYNYLNWFNKIHEIIRMIIYKPLLELDKYLMVDFSPFETIDYLINEIDRKTFFYGFKSVTLL